jgi:hypothetical protein
MQYSEFQSVISPQRMSRYLAACGGDSRKAMTLYRKNLKLSQEMFTVISCFEVALRNKIDQHYTNKFGPDWLRDAASLGGMFATQSCRSTAQVVYDEVLKLNAHYSHPKLVAALGFGFWRYLFSDHQYRAGGQDLINIFPNKLPSTPSVAYNAKYIFNELAKINEIRNRIAHHEPICFVTRSPVKDTNYARQHYHQIITLFQWMDIDESALLYGLDHIITVCGEIDSL